MSNSQDQILLKTASVLANSQNKILLKTASVLAIGGIGLAIWAINRNPDPNQGGNFNKPPQHQTVNDFLQSTSSQSNVQISKINIQEVKMIDSLAEKLQRQSTSSQSNVQISKINIQEVKMIDSLAEKLSSFHRKMKQKNLTLIIEQQNLENRSDSSLSSSVKSDKYKCPLTQKIMINPAVASFNCQCRIVSRFQRQAIQKWLDQQNCCPICGIKLVEKYSIKDDQLIKHKIMKLNRQVNKKRCVDKVQSQKRQNVNNSQQLITKQKQEPNFFKKNSSILVSNKTVKSSIISNSHEDNYQGQNQQPNHESVRGQNEAVSEYSEMMPQVPEKSVQNQSDDSQATHK